MNIKDWIIMFVTIVIGIIMIPVSLMLLFPLMIFIGLFLMTLYCPFILIYFCNVIIYYFPIWLLAIILVILFS